MQDVTPQLASGAQVITSYGDTGFTIAGVHHAGSVLVTPQSVMPWLVRAVNDLTPESLAPLLATKPEVLIIGTGARHEMIAPSLRTALKAGGIAFDTMDTGAACRTYNILLTEGRRVSTALILGANV